MIVSYAIRKRGFESQSPFRCLALILDEMRASINCLKEKWPDVAVNKSFVIRLRSAWTKWMSLPNPSRSMLQKKEGARRRSSDGMPISRTGARELKWETARPTYPTISTTVARQPHMQRRCLQMPGTKSRTKYYVLCFTRRYQCNPVESPYCGFPKSCPFLHKRNQPSQIFTIS